MTPDRQFSSVCMVSLAALLALGAAGIIESCQSAEARDESPSVIYSHGTVHATIPYRSLHHGVGQLTVEVLDPEDRPAARAERQVDVDGQGGNWQQDLGISKALSLDELAWHRLRYRFAYADSKEAVLEGTESISQILRLPVIHVLGQRSYLTGGAAAVRIVVTDSRNQPIAGPSAVRIELLNAGHNARPLFSGRLNSRGTTEAQFRFPPGVAGSYAMRYAVDTPIGSAEISQPVRLNDKPAILLTTEKPVYQPGQTIHVRALALDRSNHEATSNRKLTFEVEDSRGNKVFRKPAETDKFGVAFAEFTLADEVNLGTYHLRAVLDKPGESPVSAAEIALNVERYVLPKFKVAVEFDGRDKRARHGYRPGDHLTGTVRANYFFGKPVDGAGITVKGSGIDAGQFEIGSVTGKTDGDGAYRFDLRLPNYFAGRPLSGGAARVLLEATVTDSAGHAETRGEPVTVSDSPLLVTAVPEGGTLAPHLENQIFILTSYPDGTPAPAKLSIRSDGNPEQQVTADAGGVSIARIEAGAGAQTLKIEAQDMEGNRTSTSIRLEPRAGTDQILLRAEHAVYRTGDRVQMKIYSTRARGAAYVDVVKQGQTVMTRDLDIVNGQAELTLTATPDLAGSVDIGAYLFGGDARPVGDHRLIFVQPADELKIDASADAQVYRPGDDARIRFRVTNSHGQGVQAALGVQVVDEAVFALAEKQPGFAKVFFYLEQEVMKPRYEIHSVTLPEIVHPVKPIVLDRQPVNAVEGRDRAALALFAATEVVTANRFETEFGRVVPQTRYAEYAQRYQLRFKDQVRQLAASLTRAYRQHPEAGDLIQAAAKFSNQGAADWRDSWNNNVRIETMPWNSRGLYIVRSAGPDKQFNSPDDLVDYLSLRAGKVTGWPTSATIDLNIEHDRGPFNGLANIAGSVEDETGAGIAGATVTAREVSTGTSRTTTVNAAGQFSLPAVPAGEYQVVISSMGFENASKKFTLQARDRAVLSAVLTVGSVNQVVVMEQEGRVFARQLDAGGVVGGIVDGRLRFGGNLMREAMPAPPMAARAEMGMVAKASSLTLAKDAPAQPAPRVRSYFPEALYINPEIVTDQAGRASISIPLADSITTWRIAMLASTAHGALGSGTSSLRVFQDFFVDLDLPVTLTQGDRVSIPVAAYNYSGKSGKVSLELHQDAWFGLIGDVADKSIDVDSGRVGAAQFTLQANRIGKFKLTLSAKMNGEDRADIVVREIEVVPNGREQNVVFNGRLENAVHHDLHFPQASIPDASAIVVRLYPGPLSQVIEGMDAILRMPGGCFEQTSSSTYPNVLALDYMKRTNKLTPEVHAKAEGYIANGYQRLLTFEVPGGGFSWFGNPPANKILTSYGLMEFSDMSKVHDVDPKLIQRTQEWLAGQQQADGSWKPDTQFINEGATNRYNSDLLRITAYIAWALENTGYQGPAVDKAKQFVERQTGRNMDGYTLAVLANFAVDYAKDREFTRQAMQLLLDARTEKDQQAWWTSPETGVYATGESATIETTGLAVQALLKWGGANETARKALGYLSSKKTASGNWGSTQATIMALRALLLGSERNGADVRGTVEVTLNGKRADTVTLTGENNDLLHQFVYKGIDARGPNAVDIRFTGKGGLAYQVVGRYFIPWNEKPAQREPLSIEVAYDRSQLAQNDIATATATVKNNLTKVANMVMVDLGIPPGFDLLSEDLQSYQEKSAGRKSGRMEKFSLTATQAILYFDSIAPGDKVTLVFRLRAKYPIRAHTFQSRVYEYYDPSVNSVARPVALEVRKR